MRYAADIADAGPFKGQWVVVDYLTGQLAENRSFPRGDDAKSYANFLNMMEATA